MTSLQKIESTARLHSSLSKEDKEKFLSQYKAARPVIEQILAVLKEDLEKEIEQSEKEINFSEPNWALAQAFSKGRANALRDVTKLLNRNTKGRP